MSDPINFTELGFERRKYFMVEGEGIFIRISNFLKMWFFNADTIIRKDNVNRPTKRYVKKLGKGELKIIHKTIIRDMGRKNSFDENEFILYYEYGNRVDLIMKGNKSKKTKSELVSAIREFRLKTLLD